MRESTKDKSAMEMMARDATLCQKLNLALPPSIKLSHVTSK